MVCPFAYIKPSLISRYLYQSSDAEPICSDIYHSKFKGNLKGVVTVAKRNLKGVVSVAKR